LAMRSLRLVFMVLFLLSYVPPGKNGSGMNPYIKEAFDKCWLMKDVCRKKCGKNEIDHIVCDNADVCCITEEEMPILVG
ncbi:Beta-defensin 30, partial [Heterocephalus glaber]